MSFIIAAIYKNKDVYLAADSQMTNIYTNTIVHGENKIEKFGESVGVAYAGSPSLCKQILGTLKGDYSKMEYIPVDQKDIASDIAKYAEKISPQWSRENLGAPPEAVFLVAGYNGIVTPAVTTITISSDQSVRLHTKMWDAGNYHIAVSSPMDIHFDDCIQLCIQFLSQRDNHNKAAAATLEDLIVQIAARSRLSDHYPNIWHAKYPLIP